MFVNETFNRRTDRLILPNHPRNAAEQFSKFFFCFAEVFIRLRGIIEIRNDQSNDLFTGHNGAPDPFPQGDSVPMIIGEIRRHLRDNNAIRVSRSLRDTAYKALQVRNRLTGANGNEPTLAEIAKEMDMSEDDVTFALDAIQEPVSLFEPVYRDDGDAVYMIDQLSDAKTADVNWLESIAINDGMAHLSEREMRILRLRFFIGKTQMEVSREIGISQAQVSRLEKGALKQLRKFV